MAIDEYGDAESLARLLQQVGKRGMERPIEPLDALESGPDLVVVDLDLRIELGMKTIHAAKARDAAMSHSTPVIILAGNPEVRANGKAAGADESLATPPSFQDLQAAVIRTLSRPAAVR